MCTFNEKRNSGIEGRDKLEVLGKSHEIFSKENRVFIFELSELVKVRKKFLTTFFFWKLHFLQ